MNIGMRHILPVYPFLYVLIPGGAFVLLSMNRRWVYAIVALVLWQAFEAARVFPAYMAYGNELWGGPSGVHRYLSDSNVDWGQQLIATKKYLDEHRIKNCWLIYFPEGVVDTKPYGIPCKLLPTSEIFWWVKWPLDTPPSIDGTVLVSDSDVAGFEFGPAPLNPYEAFKSARQIAVIQHGIYVYKGHFDILLAAAYSHAERAQSLLDTHDPEAALVEAQDAVALAPNQVRTNVTLGDVLTELKRSEEAQLYYEKALTLAKTIQPAFQSGWVPIIQAKLVSK